MGVVGVEGGCGVEDLYLMRLFLSFVFRAVDVPVTRARCSCSCDGDCYSSHSGGGWVGVEDAVCAGSRLWTSSVPFLFSLGAKWRAADLYIDVVGAKNFSPAFVTYLRIVR